MALAAIQHQSIVEDRLQKLEDDMKAKDVLIEEQSQVINQFMAQWLIPGRKFNSCVSISGYNNNNKKKYQYYY